MVGKENKDEIDNHSTEMDKSIKHGKNEEFDSETLTDSVSSQGDSHTVEDEQVESNSITPKLVSKKDASKRGTPLAKTKVPQNTTKKISKSIKGSSKVSAKTTPSSNTKIVKVPSKPSSISSEGVDDIPLEEENDVDKENDVDILDGELNSFQSVSLHDEMVNVSENGEKERKAAQDQKIEEMEKRIEKLEEELREVAVLEISLYSVVPEHGSSSHKVHTPARRLSRLYIHACKHWIQDKRATIAKNTVSGLILIAKSCGNDVPRLTFWLSNIVVLREIIVQTFGNSLNSSSATKFTDFNGNGTICDGKSPILKWKGGYGAKHINKSDLLHCAEGWQETSTFTTALEKVESWIFSRIVESVWWQTLTPKMQSAMENSYINLSIERLSKPDFGDQHQGSFSIDLWKSAFEDAFQRLCPVRAGGHECGCLSVLARMVMDRCVSRLDVAMFNAILRESAHEIPTDPVSDPIVDSKVLPIPAGDLSFGSGARLKNSVGNWSQWLNDMFSMDGINKDDQYMGEENDNGSCETGPKAFNLLNSLSDLLMLPKDMLMDRSIRKELCPLIHLALVKRILCNFTPDEFCPEPVPGAVLEALNAESMAEQRISGASTDSSFPHTAEIVAYTPPTSGDVARKVADTGYKPRLVRNVSVVQKKGYTSDEELGELDSPLSSIITNSNGKHGEDYTGMNSRYELLRQVWSM